MTKPETALSAVVERTFPLSEFGDDLHDYLQRGLRDVLYADLTALISEHYTANEEVEKMVEERLREELIAYDKSEWFKTFGKKLEGQSLEATIESIDEYLKSRKP